MSRHRIIMEIDYLRLLFIGVSLNMNNKARSIIRAVAVILVLLSVVMQLRWVIIPAIDAYRFWIVVISFGMMLITSK